MLLLKRLTSWLHSSNSTIDEHFRKYRLIHIITFELITVALILILVHTRTGFWVMSYLLMMGIMVALGNLWLVRKKYNLALSGHIISSATMLLITLANFWFGGLDTSYFGWFYLPPIIATVTIGLGGMIIYGFISALMIFSFIFGFFTPMYIIPIDYVNLVNTINYIFIFLLIVTSLTSFMVENKQYESQLQKQNYLLYADKQKFHFLSHHDSLTNLPNRPFFYKQLQELMNSINTTNNRITLYFMDLDGFKQVNDQYGHEVGDVLLLQTSERLRSCFREKDFIARLGGDEFTALVIHHKDDYIADTIGDRIEKKFKEPFLIKNISILCPISVGKANYPRDTSESEILLKMADSAMYKNKKLKYMANITSAF